MRTKNLAKKLRLNKLTIANIGDREMDRVFGGKIVATDTGKLPPTETCYCAPEVDGEDLAALALVLSVNDCG